MKNYNKFISLLIIVSIFTTASHISAAAAANEVTAAEKASVWFQKAVTEKAKFIRDLSTGNIADYNAILNRIDACDNLIKDHFPHDRWARLLSAVNNEATRRSQAEEQKAE